ncbi:MAG: hypothetical protein A2Y02_01490 [Omnitrophica bacterium GWA2_52_12]|nr:MAG: hypothetical protein A2Y02_01490 [Omnitrophica bacterium GWA2_52_12]
MEKRNCAFSIQDSLAAKGAAMLLMLAHHLFAFPERLHGVSYLSSLPLLPQTSHPMEFYLGQLGKICVSMFLFLSGYGLMERMRTWTGSRVRYAAQRAWHVLAVCWTVFAIFVPIGLIFYKTLPQFHFSFVDFLKNLLLIRYTYNPEWWFFQNYFILLALFPVLSRWAEKSPRWLLAGSLALLPLSFKYPFAHNLLLHQAAFVLGLVFSKLNLFQKGAGLFFPQRGKIPWIYFGLLLLVYRARSRDEILLEPLAALLAILYSTHAARALPKAGALLAHWGAFALPLWLTHSFFCYYYFQHLVYAPRYSILIFAWLGLLSTAAAFLINRLQLSVVPKKSKLI